MPNLTLNIEKGLFNDTYFPYLMDYQHRYEIYYGGAGSGKSHFVFQKVILKALKSRRKVLVVRKVAKTNLNSTFQMTIDTLSRFQLLNKSTVNKSTLTITLPNDSQFLFLGCDDSEKLKSIAGITDIICEEATELSRDDFTQLDLRLRPRCPFPQIYLMLNPVSKANWVYKQWFEEGVEIQNNTFILKTTYKDNRFLPQDYINSLMDLARTNPTYYKIYVLGDFCSLDKLVYTNYKVEDFDYRTIGGDLCIGLDFGFVNDPSALLASIRTEDKIYIFQEWGDSGKTNPELADIIRSLGFSKSIIIADCAEQKSIEELRREGIYRVKPSVKGPDSIIHGIQRVQQYQIIVHPSCKETITELENYCWDKDKSTGEYINKPVDQFNHYLDALRYSMQCHDTGTFRAVSKSLLGL